VSLPFFLSRYYSLTLTDTIPFTLTTGDATGGLGPLMHANARGCRVTEQKLWCNLGNSTVLLWPQHHALGEVSGHRGVRPFAHTPGTQTRRSAQGTKAWLSQQRQCRPSQAGDAMTSESFLLSQAISPPSHHLHTSRQPLPHLPIESHSAAIHTKISNRRHVFSLG